jgi:hypothetical protein
MASAAAADKATTPRTLAEVPALIDAKLAALKADIAGQMNGRLREFQENMLESLKGMFSEFKSDVKAELKADSKEEIKPANAPERAPAAETAVAASSSSDALAAHEERLADPSGDTSLEHRLKTLELEIATRAGRHSSPSAEKHDRFAADLKTLQTTTPKWDGTSETFPAWRANVEYGFSVTALTWTDKQKVDWILHAGIAPSVDGVIKQLSTADTTPSKFLDQISAIVNLTNEVDGQWRSLNRASNEAFNVFAARAGAIFRRRFNKNGDDAVLIDRLRNSLTTEVDTAVTMHLKAQKKDAISFVDLISCVMAFETKNQVRRNPVIGQVNAVSEAASETDSALSNKILQNISAMTTQAVQAHQLVLTATQALAREAQARAATATAQTAPAPYYRQPQYQPQQQQPQQYGSARSPVVRSGVAPQGASGQPATFFAGNCRACKVYGHKAQDCPLQQVMAIERINELIAMNVAEDDDQVAAIDHSASASASETVDAASHSNATRRH